jgi:sugar phosphate isomerase/epimerase
MKTFKVSHFFDFADYPQNEWADIFAEFARNNAEYITINTALLKLMLTDEKVIDTFIELGREFNIKFCDIHGLCGKGYDLNTPDEKAREIMIQHHAKAFEIAEKLGVKTYVMHIGAWCCVENCWYEQQDFLRQLAIESLEKLLPIAEKYGVTIAIENAFEPSNTPDELLYFLERVKSPALGACFDAGHATMMSDVMVKRDRDENDDPNRKPLWHGRLEFQSDALEKIAPYVVTCHLHDNDGYNDQHKLIFSGVANWQKYMDTLRKCPRLVSLQNEIKSNGAPIAEMCQAFERLLKL